MYNLQDVSVDVGGLRLCEKRCTKQTNKQTNKSTSSSCQLMHIAQIRLHLSTTASDPLWSSGLLLKWSVTNARVPLSAGRDERVACCPCNPVWPQLGPATVGLHPQLGPLQSDFSPNWPYSSRTLVVRLPCAHSSEHTVIRHRAGLSMDSLSTEGKAEV